MRTCLALAASCFACGAPAPAAAPCPAPPAAASTATSTTTSTATPTPVPSSPALRIILHPRPDEPPRLSVELAVAFPPGIDLRALRVADAAPASLENLVATDPKGRIDATIAPAPPGLAVTFARAPETPLRISYDVRATPNARASTSALVVADDRFRAFGERFVLMPDALEDAAVETTVVIDGSALRAPDAASSFGLGAARTRTARGRALVHAAFVAGSLGKASLDTGTEHDEAAWLGYTAFDPRAVAAEIAGLRTAMRERWHGGGEESFGVTFVSSARPAGAYAILPRASSLVLHLGPNEPWSAALRVGVATHLMQTWIGGELRIGPGDALWFSEGVARFLSAQLLEELELLSPDDARDFIEGMLSVQAASPHRGKRAAELAVADTGEPVARAHLAALGALHAARVSAAMRARSKGARTLWAATLDLLNRARETHAALPDSAWTDMLAKELGVEQANREWAQLQADSGVVLPDGALGPCFRATRGEYAAFDLGFDALATAESSGRTIVALDPNGPAAKAGVLATDVLDDATYRIGHAQTPAKLSLLRGGAKTEVTYRPAGARHAGQVWTRVAGKRDEACGEVL